MVTASGLTIKNYVVQFIFSELKTVQMRYLNIIYGARHIQPLKPFDLLQVLPKNLLLLLNQVFRRSFRGLTFKLSETDSLLRID